MIPDLRARILKDAANNMLAKKESNKEKDIEKKKKKIKVKSNRDVNVITLRRSKSIFMIGSCSN